MNLTYPEIEILRAVEQTQTEGASFAHIEEIAEKLNDPPLVGDRTELVDALKNLRNKKLIAFEVGEGVRITEGGTVALRAI